MKTTKKMTRSSAALVALLCAHAAFGGLGEERQSRTYQSAMEDYSAGRLDAAVTGFEKAIEANGNNASARFQLACILQDYRRDWLGAMCSYREYLRLEGKSEKAPLARERLAQCERELASELAAKYSLSAPAGDANASVASRKDLDEAQRNAAAAQKALDEARKRLATLERENTRLRRQLRSIGDDADASSPKAGVISARDLLNDEDDSAAAPRRISAIPRDDVEGAASPRKMDVKAATAIVDDGRSSPTATANPAAFEPDDGATGLRQGLADAKKLVEEDGAGPTLLQGEDHSSPVVRGRLSDFAANRSGDDKNEGRGDRPESYVVQDGDSLYKIARRFYGKESEWKKIRDANKATISTDGRVKAGQTIILP